MGCTHAASCPLFPYLNASLAGWREAYCDSIGEWRDCARFELARAGKPVPLALLPNGHLPVAMLPGSERSSSVNSPTSPPPEPALRATQQARLSQRPSQQSWPPDRPDADAVAVTGKRTSAGRGPARRPPESWWVRLARWLREPA